MFDDIIDEAKSSMDKAIESLVKDLQRVRTGRANLIMLDPIRVDYYGTKTPLNQVAALAVSDARTITIKPWEKPLLSEIERAIINSNLGITPLNDGDMLRLPIPPLSNERRQVLCKQVRQRGEDGKVAMRSCRRDGNEMIKAEDGTSEDDVKRALKVMQEQTDGYVTQVDSLISAKEAEVMEV
jgi:ribosome recycling factor